MALRKKMRSVALGMASEPTFFSALRTRWTAISTFSSPAANLHASSLKRDLGKDDCAAELHPLIDALLVTRRRIMATNFLSGWMMWCSCILATLIFIAAVSTRLAGAVILSGVLAAVGTAALAVLTWRGRPSIYDTACRLDSASTLHDRLSTALFFGTIEKPEGMLELQRRDASQQLAQINPRGLFPIRVPANAIGRTVVLFLAVAGLFVYRTHYRPPLVALMQTAARSQLVQSVLSPLVSAVEKDLQRTMALATSQPDTSANDVRPDDAKPLGDDLWQSNDEKDANPEDTQQNSQDATIADQQPQQPNPDGQAKPKEGESQQQADGQQQSQAEGKKSSQSKENSDQSSGDGNQSQSQSLMQALKNLLSNSASQQSNNQANQPPPDGQGMSQSGNSHQPGTSEGDKKGDSRGSSDGQQKASKNSSSGAGSQQGNKDLRKDQSAQTVNAVPDRVALESNGFKEQVRVRVDTGTGTAQLPVREISPTATAVVNGAEQENIPARYRLYVQHYFEHGDNNVQK